LLRSIAARGLGSLIVEELIARARRRNIRQLRVLTETPWESPNALCRSFGFVEVGADGTDTQFSMAL
jgi:L-amino acid N-acyltransferase YncA